MAEIWSCHKQSLAQHVASWDWRKMTRSWDWGIMAHDHHAIAAIDRSSPNRMAPDFHAAFPYKMVFFPLCILTLDWIVKELSGFREKSWVLHDPPTFRLDCDPIGAVLIMNRRLIRSNSPLERRKYVEEGTNQIHSNLHDLEPDLHLNQVSSVNQSFILR